MDKVPDVEKLCGLLRVALQEWCRTDDNERIGECVKAFVSELPVEFKARVYNEAMAQLTRPKEPIADETQDDEKAPPVDAVLAMRPEFGEDIEKIMAMDVKKVKVKKTKRRY